MEFFGMDMPSFISVMALAVLVALFFVVRKDSSYDSISPVSVRSFKKKPAGPESRRHVRLDVDWPITMDTSCGKLNATLANISMGGAFITCNEPLPLYEQFTLNIDSKGKSDVTINAEVLWSNVNVSDDMIHNRGMGIRFVHNADDVRQFLNKIITELVTQERDAET